MNELPEHLRQALLELLYHTLLHIRASSTEPKLVWVHSNHVHNIPNLIAYFKPDLLKYYWEVERLCFLEDLPPDADVPQVFERLWATIEREYERLCRK